MAGGMVEVRHSCVSVPRRPREARFVLGTVDHGDSRQKVVSWSGLEGASGQVGYDRLILTAGSISKLLPIPGLPITRTGSTASPKRSACATTSPPARADRGGYRSAIRRLMRGGAEDRRPKHRANSWIRRAASRRWSRSDFDPLAGAAHSAPRRGLIGLVPAPLAGNLGGKVGRRLRVGAPMARPSSRCEPAKTASDERHTDADDEVSITSGRSGGSSPDTSAPDSATGPPVR